MPFIETELAIRILSRPPLCYGDRGRDTLDRVYADVFEVRMRLSGIISFRARMR